MATNEHGSCVQCGLDFNGGMIWQHFYDEFTTGAGYWLDENGKYIEERRILSHEEAERVADVVAEHYGATRTLGRWGKKIIITRNDRFAYYECPDCGARQ